MSTSASTATASAAALAAPDAKAAAAAAGASGGDEPPAGSPKKPLLAAAGIAGVVLLAVPLLIWATDDSEQKKDTVSVAAASDTLLDDESALAPQRDYAPSKPTPALTPTPAPTSAKPSATPEPKPTGTGPTSRPPSPAPGPASAPVRKEAPVAAGVTQPPAPRPPQNTAALAVQRLAASSPGRHICYRAYVTGIGWQSPVCDGATAGTEGQSRPIKALNIAVSGTRGTSANEFIQKDGWTTKWEGVVDGIDLSIGRAAKNAPNMSGFAISVGDGVVCQTAHVSSGGWLGLGCDKPGGYIFGGSLERERWLEAVRFTV